MAAHPARPMPMTTARLQAFADAWNSHDVEVLMSFMADDCEFEYVWVTTPLLRPWSSRAY